MTGNGHRLFAAESGLAGSLLSQFDVWSSIGALLQEASRILRNALVTDFEMQVRPRRTTGIATGADFLAAFYHLPGLDDYFGEMGIP
jgi:hypothetical protein